METSPTATATRTTKNGKSVITLNYAGNDTTTGDEWTVGGKRADRAAAVLLVKFADEDHARFFGARADLAKAQAEARTHLATQRRLPSQFRGQKARYVDVTPAEWAIAVPVTVED